MEVLRGYRFKLKPTQEIEHTFVVMAGHTRFVWNKALRLNLDRLNQQVPIIWYNDLCGLLHLWKQSEEYGFLAEANAQALQQKLKDLSQAFSDAFDPTQPGKRIPRFKQRGVDDAFRFPQGVRIENRRVFLPKVGWVGFFQSRDVPGTIKQATVSREADGWYVSILAETVVAEPTPRAEPVVGVDRGVAVFAATSDGELVEPLNAAKRMADQMRRLQRQLARRKKGGKNRAKIKRRIARLHQRIARMRADFLHKLSTRWAKSHGTIVLEDLRIGNMTRSARGTVDAPGRKVAAKSGLNRAILDQGWGMFARMLGYKLDASGGFLVPVPQQYSSQTCAACGHVDAASRPDRDVFRCVACGHVEHADINAAKVILQRGLVA